MQNDPPFCVRRLEHGRYLVRSERPRSEDWYLCDLDDPKFPDGRCECDDFNIRIESAIRRLEEPIRWRCKHLRRVHAELQHAEALCAAAGLPFSPAIIPPP